MPAEWGGETNSSSLGKQKKGIEKLLEILLLVADLRELKANRRTRDWNSSRIPCGQGPRSGRYVLVQNGTLRSGDFFICGAVFGKVRAMFDDRGRPVKEAPPSRGGSARPTGRSRSGRHFSVTDEAKARTLWTTANRTARRGASCTLYGCAHHLDQLHEQSKPRSQELPIVIKATSRAASKF